MTSEELNKAVAAMLSDGDNDVKTAAGNSIIEAFKTLDAQNTTLTKENEELTARNTKLNEANASYFLSSIGAKPEEVEEKEETPKERFAKLFDEKYYPKKGEAK